MREATLLKLKQLKFTGMYRAYVDSVETGQLNKMDNDLFLSQLIDCEWDERYNRRIERLIRAASFHYRASVEEILYEEDRNLERGKIEQLAQCNYMDKGEDILITGATGTGKSYLATALGFQACLEGKKVLYLNTNKLFARMRSAKLEGTYIKELTKLERFHLLIFDDFGMQSPDKGDRITLLEIIEDRQEKGSIIVTSQLPVSKWFDVIGERTVADAIMDRLSHQSHRIELKGESMRKKMRKVNK